LRKEVKTESLFSSIPDYIKPLFEGTLYPWEVLPKIKGYITELAEKGIEGFTEIKKGVLVGENVKIHPLSDIEAPAIIGHNTEIRPGAYIRGAVITGEGCVLGNSSEFKNAVLFDHVQAPHYNYIGDSILGNYSHMGAGSICSNLKSDGKNVVIHSEEEIDTNLRKVGAILADHADVGCACVLNPGTVIGKNTSVYPTLSLRGVIPCDCIVKAPDNVVKKENRN